MSSSDTRERERETQATDVAIDPADRQQVNVMSQQQLQQQQQQHCEVPQATPILIFMLRIPIQPPTSTSSTHLAT